MGVQKNTVQGMSRRIIEINGTEMSRRVVEIYGTRDVQENSRSIRYNVQAKIQNSRITMFSLLQFSFTYKGIRRMITITLKILKIIYRTLHTSHNQFAIFLKYKMYGLVIPSPLYRCCYLKIINVI